jgi:hypothetical protein
MSLFVAPMLALFAGTMCAQGAVKIDAMEVQEHRIGPRRSIHSKVQIPFGHSDYVTLRVAVNTRGDVESAHSVYGPEEFFSEAESVELNRKFKPFERDGVAVAASITDEVSIFPLEQWAETDVPFPEILDWSTLKMSLKRTVCFGACPAYSVVVGGSGDVEFDGGSGSRITGHHRGQVSRQAVESLLHEFQRANYFSLKDDYVTRVTDSPTYTTSIEFDGKKKTVRDYVGLRSGMPEAVTDLENAIDEALGTEKWVKGTQKQWRRERPRSGISRLIRNRTPEPT